MSDRPEHFVIVGLNHQQLNWVRRKFGRPSLVRSIAHDMYVRVRGGTFIGEASMSRLEHHSRKLPNAVYCTLQEARYNDWI